MKLLQHLVRITPGATLAPIRGLRTAGALGLALLVLAASGHTPSGRALGLGFMLGVLFTSFCDVGVSVRMRAVAMSVLTLGGPLAVAGGRSLAAPWWLAAQAVFVVTLFAGFLSRYGPQVSQVGVLLTIVFVVTLGSDGGPGTALSSAFGFLLGGAVVLLLLLISSLPARLRDRAARTVPPLSGQVPPAPAHGLSLSLVTPHAPLNVRSPLLETGLLRAHGAGGAAVFAWKLGTPYPQWAPIVVIACVQPEKDASVLAVAQNSIGTVLGAQLADVLITSVQHSVVVALIMVVVVFIAFTVKDLNFALYTFVMTNFTLYCLITSTTTWVLDLVTNTACYCYGFLRSCCNDNVFLCIPSDASRPCDPLPFWMPRCRLRPSTTSLVSSWTKGSDLVSLDQPEDDLLEEPEQHLPMHEGQRATGDRGGKTPRQEAEAAARRCSMRKL